MLLQKTLYLYVLAALSLLGSSYGEKSMQGKIWRSLGPVDSRFIPTTKGRGMNLNVAVNIVTLSDVDESAGTMRIGYWLKLSWNVSSLRWDPKDFDGVKDIRVPASEMWVPDVVPYVHGDFKVMETNAVLSHTGYVLWIPYIHATIPCFFNPKPLYPRDEMACKLKLGSWTFDGYQLNLTTDSQKEVEKTLTQELISQPLESSGWKFQRATLLYQVITYPCCPEPYPSVVITIDAKRNSLYYGVAIAVPAIVVGLTSAFLYLLPPISPARVISQMVCLLIFVFIGVTDLRLMGSTVLMAPAAHYFIAAMILDLLAVCWSILTAVAWMQASGKASSRSTIDSVLSKLECICCLPPAADQQQGQVEEGKESHGVGLLAGQRFILLLDRLFALVNVAILIILFIYMSA